MTGGQAGSQAETGGAGVPAWDPVGLLEWLQTTLFPVYLRPLGRPGMRWCSRWWAHAEAWVRFAACHRAWLELAAQEGTGLSVWHRDHLDPMLRELLGESGPFANCVPSQHDPARARHVQLPQFLFDPIPQENAG